MNDAEVSRDSFGDLECYDVVMQTGAVSEAGMESVWGKRTYIRPTQTIVVSSAHPVH